ncbi:transporter substrate-binding domain-containing protein [Pseudomonas sp. CAU 1711]|uniref:substrate-binding periplasmic protein n=1 Tax=Pseudomonas sp. CAU 1711 TaxID=3140356 RepID=UPI0032619C06
MRRYALVLALLCTLLPRAAWAEETLRITIGEWPPFISAGQPGNGVLPRLISEVFASQGVTVEYGFFPWKRSYEEVRRGRWHASAVWGKTPERERDCWFSEVLYSDEVVLFYNKARPLHWDGSLEQAGQRLRGLRIGLPLGSAKSPVLAEAERLGWVSYEIGGDEMTNLRKLAAGRIDALDIVKGSATYLINRRLSPRERDSLASTAPLQRWDYHLIFSRQREENLHYLELFDHGLAELRRNGRYAAIWSEFYGAAQHP